MSSQIPIAPANPAPTSGFRIENVDDKLKPAADEKARAKTLAAVTPVEDPPLGVLINFKGEFAGTGLNTIFRPNSGPATGTKFPKPVSPEPPAKPNENVLELNLTTETLRFDEPLGTVPNRGLGQVPADGLGLGQGDIFLNGVPYLQKINDVTNTDTGKADGVAAGIHFEPGLWMHVPATTDPAVGASLVRMASIPHGTTINAQALDPFPDDGLDATITKPSGPEIAPVDITPFLIGQPDKKIKFAAQTASDDATPRLPQDLSKFIAAGTITQEILDDPNVVLRKHIVGQNITNTTVFTASTVPAAADGKLANAGLGGGTANMAMLLGEPDATKPNPHENANAVQMSSIFWIETVQSTLEVPVWKPGQPSLKIQVPAPNPDAPQGPFFCVQPPHEITEPKTITVSWTQIQYSQNVALNFAGLTWPHVSVATLVPTAELKVPDSAWN